MDDLIRVLQILRKYGNPEWPTHCEHDVLRINIDPSLVSEGDLKTLEGLGVEPDNEFNVFKSYKYGSA